MFKKFFIASAIVGLTLLSCGDDDDTAVAFGVSVISYGFDSDGDSTLINVYADGGESWELRFGEEGGKSWCSFDKEGTIFEMTGAGSLSSVWIYSAANDSRYEKEDTLFVLNRTLGTEQEVPLALEAMQIAVTADTVQYVAQPADVIEMPTIYNLDYATLTANVDWITNISINTTTKVLSYDISANTSTFARIGVITVAGGWLEPVDDISVDIEIIQDPNTTLKSDSTALVALNTQYNLGWDVNTPISTWKNVEVTQVVTSKGYESRVIGLNLSGEAMKEQRGSILSGSLPELGELTYLKYLRLNDNDFSGEIPQSYYSLNQLELLWLSGNSGLTGELSESVGNLQNLNNISIANTQIGGNLPAALGTLENLISVVLNDNMFTGTLESISELGNNSSLTVLMLKGNKLTGTIPTSFVDNTSWYNWEPYTNIIPQQDNDLTFITQ